VDLSKCNPVEAALSGDEVFETKDEFLSNSRLSSVPVAMRARELLFVALGGFEKFLGSGSTLVA